jgi:ATP/maltotriose-dependent transcriptional regulator MalT
VLASLVDKSLVLIEPQADCVRYRLLESTRAYALERLVEAGEHDTVAGRHLRYFRDHFRELWERFEQTARFSDLDTALQTELEDARSALDAALAGSEIVDGGELLANISMGWQAIGLEAEGMARCEAYLAALPENQLRVRAVLSSVLSYLLGYSGQKVRAFELATDAVELARASGDAPSLAWVLRTYAGAAAFLHRFDDAERALTDAEAIPRTSASVRIGLINMRASLSAIRGDLEMAARMYEQLHKEHQALGNARGAQLAALNLAEVTHARGQPKRAAAIICEALPPARSGADKNLLGVLLINLAGYLVAVDDLPGATSVGLEAIAIRAAEEPSHVHVAIAIEHLALVAALGGDSGLAATLESYADATFQGHGYRREFTETTTHDRLATILRETLAPDQLARRATEGAALTPEAAIALASRDTA